MISDRRATNTKATRCVVQRPSARFVMRFLFSKEVRFGDFCEFSIPGGRLGSDQILLCSETHM